MSKLIPIIIPSYEPDERLEPLLKSLLESELGPVVMVDDGSGDEYKKYFDAAKSLGVTVLVHEKNKGKGRALKTAFEYCLKNYPDMIGCVTADSDGQHTPNDIKKCMDVLSENENNLVMGCRNFTGDDIPWKSSFGNNVTKKVCKYLCGVSVSDTQTGLRAIPKKFMEELLAVKGERFEFETNMLLESKDSYEIIEVPIETIYESVENHQTHFRPIKDSIKIYRIFGVKFFKFVFSSLSSSGLDLLLFYLFCRMLQDDSKIYVVFATILARIISGTYNYLINYKLVFKSKEKWSKAFSRYVLLAVIQMSLSAACTTLVVNLAHWPRMFGKIVVDLTLFLISFVVQREFVFKTKRKK